MFYFFIQRIYYIFLKVFYFIVPFKAILFPRSLIEIQWSKRKQQGNENMSEWEVNKILRKCSSWNHLFTSLHFWRKYTHDPCQHETIILLALEARSIPRKYKIILVCCWNQWMTEIRMCYSQHDCVCARIRTGY